MKSLRGGVACLLTACSVTAALLFGASVPAQAGELSPRCPGGCAQSAPGGFQVSAHQDGEAVAQCSGGCIQWAQAAPAAETVGAEGNWDPY